MSINEMFTSEATVATPSARALPGTIELTRMASSMAKAAIDTMNSEADKYSERVKNSITSSAEMDAIVEELSTVPEEASTLLTPMSKDAIESMLKSQQSKRSRLKSKTNTMENYTSMLTAAIAEHLIRTVTNRPKKALGNFGHRVALDITDEELQNLAGDQTALRKEIRNIQSKKSIMKSKANFSEEDEQWQKLLTAESRLKSVRTGTGGDVTKLGIQNLLKDIQIDSLKSADSKDLLHKIADLINA